MSTIGYMCKTDYECELKEVGAFVYDSIKALKDQRSCVSQCGIVKVEIKLLNVEQETNWSNKKNA